MARSKDKSRSAASNSEVIEIWKTTIEVQKHFNELELRIRNFAITVYGAFLALAGLAIKEKVRFMIGDHCVHLAGFVLLASLIPWLAFYFMDRFWYHRLLQGAVQHATFIEESYAKTIPELKLTGTIGKNSPVSTPVTNFFLHSGDKMDLFYLCIGFLTILAGIVLIIVL